jgi:hypothetical protein
MRTERQQVGDNLINQEIKYEKRKNKNTHANPQIMRNKKHKSSWVVVRKRFPIIKKHKIFQ